MIPRKIHYCWFGGNPLPKTVRKCIDSWRKYCVDYEIIEWNESNYDLTRNQYMLDAYREKKWGFVPDFARADIIFTHGGIYLDTDVQIIKCFDSLLDCNSFFGFEDDNTGEYFVNLGHGFAAEKGNELVKKIVDSYQKLSFYNEDGSMNLIPSPQLNSIEFLKFGFQMNNQLQEIDGNILYPGDFFDPKNFGTGKLTISDNTYSIHHYDASWFDEDKKEQLQENWKQYKKSERIDKLVHLPNRLLMYILGQEKYRKFKKKLRR